MRLVENWRSVLKRAWSVRLLAIAAILSGLEGVLPLLDAFVPWWAHVIIVVATPFVIAGALVARIVVQKRLSAATPEGIEE